MNNDLEDRAQQIRDEIADLEKKTAKLKEEEKKLTLHIMNNIEYKEEENITSTYFARIFRDLEVKVFMCLNKVRQEDVVNIKKLIDAAIENFNDDNVDEHYIKILDAAKESSKIVDDGGSFTLVVLDSNKTYAFAEGNSNIYEYNNGYITPVELTNKIGELSYEVLNKNDYIRLIVFSYSNIEDLDDDKIKIITRKTDRETLIKTII